jgi:hypothetical protein
VIGVERKGRLGNQMFVCAFGIWASQILDAPFYLAEGELHRFVVLDGIRRAPSALFRGLRRVGVVKRRRVSFRVEPSEGRAALSDWTHYDGYFQSEAWFAGAEDAVRRAFRPREPRPVPSGDYICVNVRRGDYRTHLDGKLLIGPEWYKRALVELGVNAPVLFVGDEDISGEFSDVPDAAFQRAGDPSADLQAVMGARWIVLSASTFSWWGAWLNERAEAVIVPRYWTGFRDGREWPPHVIPARWTQLEVE